VSNEIYQARVRDELRGATLALSPTIRLWMGRALRSGWFHFCSGTYSAADFACPFAAAAQMAGVWVGDGIREGLESEWGPADEPSDEVEEFAAWFDLCTEECGIAVALELVSGELGVERGRIAA
jgi:hypothetical protein